MSTTPASQKPDRNLALELVRVTEAAALAAARMVGRGDKEGADQAAVDAMRLVLTRSRWTAWSSSARGKGRGADALLTGAIGDGTPPLVDVAVDPLEGTRLTALGMPSAISVIALSERGSMFDPGPIVYMEKIAGGPDIADLLDLDRPLPETLGLIAERKQIDIRDVMVVMLDRERHHDAMAEIREAGAGAAHHRRRRVRVVAGRQRELTRRPAWGIGGTEGVISASAIKCIGGQLLGRLWPRTEDERTAAVQAGYNLAQILTCYDLVQGENAFFSATGVTDGDVLQGVRYQGDRGSTTESLVMRSRSGTVRRIHARHDRAKMRAMGITSYG
jgi:fructose-1,6-bisphosphatase II